MKKILLLAFLFFFAASGKIFAVDSGDVNLPGMKREISTVSADVVSVDVVSIDAISADTTISADIDDDDFLISDDDLRTRGDFIAALDLLSDDNRQALAEIVGVKQNSSGAIYAQLGRDYSNAATALWARYVGRDITYPDIVKAVAKRMKVSAKGKTLSHLEMEIIAIQTAAVYEKMPDDEKKEVSRNVIEQLEKSGAWELLDEKTRETIEKENLTSGLIILLNPGFISGVTTNMIKNLVTTTNTEMAAVMGVSAAAAAVLTGGSVGSVISMLTGPVGWAALGSYFAWKYLDTDYKTLTNFVTAFAMMRR